MARQAGSSVGVCVGATRGSSPLRLLRNSFAARLEPRTCSAACDPCCEMIARSCSGSDRRLRQMTPTNRHSSRNRRLTESSALPGRFLRRRFYRPLLRLPRRRLRGFEVPGARVTRLHQVLSEPGARLRRQRPALLHNLLRRLRRRLSDLGCGGQCAPDRRSHVSDLDTVAVTAGRKHSGLVGHGGNARTDEETHHGQRQWLDAHLPRLPQQRRRGGRADRLSPDVPPRVRICKGRLGLPSLFRGWW
jgi:hypothetical protein